MFKAVKTALRISSGAYNDEIKNIIKAALADLRIAGVTFPLPPAADAASPLKDGGEKASFSEGGGTRVTEGVDPLILQAVILYAKVHFGFLNDTERFKSAYEHLKIALALSGEYSGERSDD